MAIQNILPDLTHIARTTYQWEHTADKYEIIPNGVLCIEFVKVDQTLIKIGDGHHIYKQLPYVSSIDLKNYYTKEETDNRIIEIFNELKSIRIKGEVRDLSNLPTDNNTEGDLWFVHRTSPSGHSRYDEYVWYKNNWESIGLSESDIDLSEYAKKEYVDEKIEEVDEKIDRYMHTHSNKEILDQITAPFTTEKDEKLESLHNYDDTEIRRIIDERTHTHSNKNILDQTSAAYTTDKDNKLASLENYDDTAVQDRLEILERIAHFHENQEILNRTTAAFTREQAITLLDCKDFEGTDGTNDGYHGFVPAPTAADAGKVLGANGQWVPMSGGGGGDTVAEGGGISITTDAQTGDKVIAVNAGTGLSIDPVTGELNVTGGGGGNDNYIAGEAIEFEDIASRLPSGYTELESISNTSASYIDTGYIPNTDTQLSIVANIHRGTTSWQTLFGARDAVNPGGTEYAFFVRLNDNYNFYPRITGDQYTYMPDQTYDEKIEISIIGTTATVVKQNGTSYSYTQTGSLSNLSTTLAIFALHNQTGYVDNGIIDLYSFKIYENNVIVKEFIPCKRNSDNTIGLFDIVNNVFYTNQGTGTFTAGRVVTLTSINVKYGDGLSIDTNGALTTTTYLAGDGIEINPYGGLLVENTEYYFDTPVSCEIRGSFNRIFQKTTADPALGVIWKCYDNNKLWGGPLFVGLTADSVKYTTEGTTFNAKGTFTYLGRTWYYSDTSYYVQNPQDQDYLGNLQVFTDAYDYVTDVVDAAKRLIDTAHVYTNNPEEISVKIGQRLKIEADGSVNAKGYLESEGISIDTTDYLLPTGYTRIKALSSTLNGNQYINTGYKLNPDTIIDMKCTLYKRGSSVWAIPLGGRVYNSYAVGGMLFVTTNSDNLVPSTGVDTPSLWIERSLNYPPSGQINLWYDDIIDLHFDNQSVTCENQRTREQSVITSQTAISATSNYDLYVFATNNGNNAAYFGVMDLYELTISENNIIIHRYIPCKRDSDDKYGLYDIIDNEFKLSPNNNLFSYVPGLPIDDINETISLLPATTTTLGGVKIGEGLSVDSEGYISSKLYKAGQGITFDEAAPEDQFKVRNLEYYFDNRVSWQINGNYGPRTFTRLSGSEQCLIAIVQTTSGGRIWTTPACIGLTETSCKYSNSYDSHIIGPDATFNYRGYTWYIGMNYGLLNSTGVDLLGNVQGPINLTSIDTSSNQNLDLVGKAIIDLAGLVVYQDSIDVWNSGTGWLNGAYNDSQSDQFWTNWYYTYHSKQNEYFEVPDGAIKMRLIGISNENDSRLQGGGVDCFNSSHHHFTSVGCVTDEWADIPEGTVYLQFGVKWNELNDRTISSSDIKSVTIDFYYDTPRNDVINAKLGNGLEFDSNDAIQVKLGTGLGFDANGALEVTGGGGGDTVAEGGGISITTDPQTGDKVISVNTGDHLEVDENTGELNVTDVDYEAGQGIHIGADYTLIEYIKNSGNYDQIIITDIIPVFSDKIELDIKFGAATVETVSDDKFFGCYNNSSTSYSYYGSLYLSSNSYANIGIYNHFKYESGNTGDNFFTYPDGVSYAGTSSVRHTLTVQGATAKWNNSTRNFSSYYNQSFSDPQIGIAIFGMNKVSGDADCFSQCNLTVYGVKLYDSNNTLLHDLRPAERGADGEAGLYDLVTHRFYGNAGNGSFVKGPAITSPGRLISAKIGNGLQFDSNNAIEVNIGNGLEIDPQTGAINVTESGDTVEAGNGIDITTDSQTGNKVISVDTGNGLQINQDGEVEIDPSIIPELTEYSAGEAINIRDVSSTLPAGYVEVDYVEGVGNYTVINYIPNRKTKVVGTASHIQTTNDPVLFGARTGSSGQQFVFWFNRYDSTQAKVGFVYGTNTWSTSSDCDNGKLIPYTLGDQFTFLISLNDEFNVNNSFVHNITENGAPASNLKLGIFALVNTPSDEIESSDQIFRGRIYEFKIYEDDELVVNLIPAISTSTNQSGFYDVINDVFYTSKTATPFGYDPSTIHSTGKVIDVNYGNGLTVNQNNELEINTGDGLSVNQNNELEVNLGSGLQFDANGAIEVTGGGGGDSIAEGEGIEITTDPLTDIKTISINYGTGLTVDPITNELMVDGQLPEGTIIKKLTYTGNGSGSSNVIKFTKKPVGILSINGSSGTNYISAIPASINSEYLHGVYGGVSNNGVSCSCRMSYNDATNELTFTQAYNGNNDPGLIYNVNDKTYTMHYLTKGHAGSGTSETNMVSVVKTFSYVGTGTSTNNIQFPETPDMLLSIAGVGGDNTYVTTTPTPMDATKLDFAISDGSNNNGVGGALMSFNDTTNVLTLTSSRSDSWAFNTSGVTYQVHYIVNEVISSSFSGTNYIPGEGIEFTELSNSLYANKVRMEITGIKSYSQQGPNAPYCQMRYFEFSDSNYTAHTVASGTAIWSDGTTVEYPSASETIDVMIDDIAKMCVEHFNGTKSLVLTFDLDSPVSYDDLQYFRYKTGFDEPSRDPISWKIYFNNTNSVNNWNLAAVVESATITNNREEWTQYFPLAVNEFNTVVISATGSSGDTVTEGDGIEITTDQQTGEKVISVNIGSGLAFDPQTGAINVTGGGGGSGDTVAEGAGIEITTDQQTGNKVIAVNAGTGLQVNQTTNELEVSSGVVTSISPTQNTPGSITVTEGDGTTTPVSVISQMGGATASTAGTAGYVPAPASGDNDAYLRGDGVWDDDVLTENDNFTITFVPDDYQPT